MTAETALTVATETAQLVERIHQIGPILEANAPLADAQRSLPDESMDAIESTGALGITTPKEHGGLGGNARMLLEAARTLARYCPAASWVTVISNGSVMLAQRFPETAQNRIFAENKPVRMSSIIVSPRGSAVPEGDGYRITGEWPFSSNSKHAEWSVGVVPLKTNDDAEAITSYVVMHRSQWSVKDTWDTIGMRGTGSNTIISQNQWVPADQLISQDAMLGPGFESRDDASSVQRLAPVSTMAAVISAPSLGAAEAALDLTAELAHKRPVTYSFHVPQASSGSFAHQLGMTRGQIEGAIMHLQRAADMVDEASQSTTPMDLQTRAHIRNHIARAMHNTADAANELAWLHGTATFANSSKIGRLWRDINTGTRHALVASLLGFEIGGTGLLGVDAPTPLV